MKITFLGQNCLQIETQGKTLLVDPFISPNELAKNISVKDIKVDYVLITHAHFDHIADAEEILQNNPKATLISNWEIVDYYTKKGIEHSHPMNTGGEWTFDFGKIKSVVALHSSTFPDGANGGCPNGYLLQIEGKVIYIAGDTALTMDMQLLPTFFGKVDVSVLPIGDNFTMGAKDAATAAQMADCQVVIPCHYDTFDYIKVNRKEANNFFADKNIELNWLEVGGVLEV